MTVIVEVEGYEGGADAVIVRVFGGAQELWSGVSDKLGLHWFPITYA